MSPLEIARIESNMMAELALYNQQQQNQSLNDGTQSEIENNSRYEEEKKYEEIEEDHKEASSIETDSRIDYNDAEEMYDTQVILKFLRLIDIFTTISNKNHNICNFTTKVLSCQRIHILIQTFTKLTAISTFNDCFEDMRQSDSVGRRPTCYCQSV